MNKFVSKYDLFIFDLDDTLVKTETYHYNAWLNVLKQELGQNFYIDYNTFISKFHSNKPDFIKHYLVNELKLTNYENVTQKKNSTYYEMIGKEIKNIKMLDGAQELLEEILNKNKKFVIVSNSLKSNVEFFCNVFPILQKCDKKYYREMLTNRKPHPECYLKVVEDFPNYRMVGFEDSITGIHSMSQVSNIDTIFVNTLEYYYYSYIINNYELKSAIKNYFNLV